MVMPVDPNSMILTGRASSPPVIIPMEDEPHVITKIIGISIMCVGGMQMVGSLFSFGTIGLNNWLESSMGSEVGEVLLPSWYYAATGLIGIIAGAIFLYSGYQIQTYQKKGIWITLGIVLASNIANLLINLSVEFPQGDTEVYPGSGIDVQLISQGSAALGSICGMVFCGIITILPLFFANHGLR
tara:strand:- start:947 stop:1501 length:555 start_codon:yes stop_codon:yes gene_type:complete